MKNIHVLPTDKPSRLFVDIDDNKLKITQPLSGEYMMNQNIYITNDIEIKEGDCFLHPDNTVERASRNLDGRGVKKIILTTDQ
jgi:CMP-N-acetylneuraminic acid synthetase